MTYSHYSAIFSFGTTMSVGPTAAPFNLLYSYNQTHSVPEINEHTMVHCYLLNKNTDQNEYSNMGTASIGTMLETNIYATASNLLDHLSDFINQMLPPFTDIIKTFQTGASASINGATSSPGHGG